MGGKVRGKKEGEEKGRVLVDLKFHGVIYPKRAVEEAMKAYQEFAHFELRTEGPYFLVSMKNQSNLEDELLKDEFCNYALGLAKKLQLAGEIAS